MFIVYSMEIRHPLRFFLYFPGSIYTLWGLYFIEAMIIDRKYWDFCFRLTSVRLFTSNMNVYIPLQPNYYVSQLRCFHGSNDAYKRLFLKAVR